MENISNNLANIETPGFKEDLLTVMQRPVESRTWLERDQIDRLGYAHSLLDAIGGGVWLHQSHTNFETGSPIHTGNDYDFMVQGNGFFKVKEHNGGREFFTRSGRFEMNPASGELISSDGKYAVLDRNGKPINIRELVDGNGGTRAVVGERGEILVQVGTQTIDTGVAIGVSVFEDDDLKSLVKVGNNNFDFGMPAGVAPPVAKQIEDLDGADPRRMRTKIRQGFFEGSGADPIMMMKQMIEVSRAYERNMNMLSTQNGTVSRLIEGVARA
jgi:flagellar basal-body rod protein FlgG